MIRGHAHDRGRARDDGHAHDDARARVLHGHAHGRGHDRSILLHVHDDVRIPDRLQLPPEALLQNHFFLP